MHCINGVYNEIQCMYIRFYSLVPSMPRSLTVTINNSTSVTLTWNTPAMPNGIIQHYMIAVVDDNMNSVQNQTVSNLMTVITKLTPNTSYVVNVSAVIVRSGDAASMTFTTPACK